MSKIKRWMQNYEWMEEVNDFQISKEIASERENIWVDWLDYQAAQHSMHLTAFGVGMLAFLVGFGICWFVFVP